MRACHEELKLCWRVGVNGSITKKTVGNLNKTEYLCIVSHLALQHTFLLSMYCEFLHTCAQVSYPIFKCEKEPMNCSWVFVEGEFLQSVLSFVRNYTTQNYAMLYPFNENALFYQERSVYSIMSKQPLELWLVKIELSSRTSLYCVTPNSKMRSLG